MIIPDLYFFNLQHFKSYFAQQLSMKTASLLVTTLVGLAFIGNVAAHGGETSDGLSNMQITLISLGLSALSFFLIPKIWDLQSNVQQKIMLSAVIYTGAVHVMLGLDDVVFMIGGVGIICLGFAPLVLEFAKTNQRIFHIGLCLNAAIMFVGYFVSNHDLHYLMEDYLGITTKVAEITILALVYKQKN